VAFGKINANFSLIPSQLFLGDPLPVSDGGIGAPSFVDALLTQFTGTVTVGDCAKWSSLGVLQDSGAPCGGGGGSSAFSSLTSGTNTAAAMQVGTGASLGPVGSGTVNANELGGLSLSAYFASPPGIGTTTPAAGAFTTGSFTSSLTTNILGSTQCVQANSAGVLSGAGSPCGSGGGSGTVNAGTSGQIAYYPGTGTIVSGANLGGNLIFTGSTLATSQAIDAQTGTIFAIPSGDAGKLITFNNASSVAASLAAASSTGFTAGYSFDTQNLGAGPVTITVASGTINGASTLVMAQNTGCTVTSDGTNYQTSACTANAPGGSSSWSNTAANTNTQALGTGATGPSLTVTNSTAATASGSANQGWSAAYVTCGNGWKTTATAGSQPVCWEMYALPVTGTSAPTSNLQFGYNVNGGSYLVPVTMAQSGVVTGAGFYADLTVAASTCGDCFYQIGANNPGISANGIEQWSFLGTGSTAQTPVYVGGTPFTVSGCGSAGTVTATGTTGTFLVGTGAGTCTFTVTVNGATAMTAAHGWIANADDVTAPTQHCINGTTVSPTTAVFTCAATVTTGDMIKVHLDPY
jgi:hypothetical protein